MRLPHPEPIFRELDEQTDAAIRQLNVDLQELLILRYEMPVNKWNSEVAPILSQLVKDLEGSTVTARTFRISTRENHGNRSSNL